MSFSTTPDASRCPSFTASCHADLQSTIPALRRLLDLAGAHWDSTLTLRRLKDVHRLGSRRQRMGIVQYLGGSCASTRCPSGVRVVAKVLPCTFACLGRRRRSLLVLSGGVLGRKRAVQSRPPRHPPHCSSWPCCHRASPLAQRIPSSSYPSADCCGRCCCYCRHGSGVLRWRLQKMKRKDVGSHAAVLGPCLMTRRRMRPAGGNPSQPTTSRWLCRVSVTVG